MTDPPAWILRWSAEQAIDWHYIAPGQLQQKVFVEAFNRRLRDGCLNEHVLVSLAETQRIVKA
jgi:putative transposase